jgi:hypothetical protein
MSLVSDLDLPVFGYTAPGFSADRYQQQLTDTSKQDRLADHIDASILDLTVERPNHGRAPYVT